MGEDNIKQIKIEYKNNMSIHITRIEQHLDLTLQI